MWNGLKTATRLSAFYAYLHLVMQTSIQTCLLHPRSPRQQNPVATPHALICMANRQGSSAPPMDRCPIKCQRSSVIASGMLLHCTIPTCAMKRMADATISAGLQVQSMHSVYKCTKDNAFATTNKHQLGPRCSNKVECQALNMTGRLRLPFRRHVLHKCPWARAHQTVNSI